MLIADRINQIRRQIEDTTSDFDKEKLQRDWQGFQAELRLLKWVRPQRQS